MYFSTAISNDSAIMLYNVLNGDSLAYSFAETAIEGEIIVMREALVDRELTGDTLHNFWQTRAKQHNISETEYNNTVVKEFEKLLTAPNNSTFNLWFEFDLFCQVNMWFVISVINSLPIAKTVYAVYTSYLDKTSKQFWNGFGPANATDLNSCYANRILFSKGDLAFGQALWDAYKDGELEVLTDLSKHESPTFPYLQEVIKAHVERFPKDGTKGRPELVMEEIIKNVSTDFGEVCKAFWSRESIYGFGDTQLKILYDKVLHEA